VVGSSVGESVIGGFVYGAGDGGFVSPASAGLAVDGGLVGSSVGCSVGEWECVGPAVPMMGAFEGFSVGDSVGMAVAGRWVRAWVIQTAWGWEICWAFQ